MALNYKPLWIQLIKKDLMKVDVIRMAGLTTDVMAQMGKNKPITFKNLERIFLKLIGAYEKNKETKSSINN